MILFNDNLRPRVFFNRQICAALKHFRDLGDEPVTSARQCFDIPLTIAALAKLNNTVKARDVCRLAREVLGGNGILLENHVVRHMADMEALYTYEGTAEIQTLIVGRDITGASAFA